jgi:hypothetical protein
MTKIFRLFKSLDLDCHRWVKDFSTKGDPDDTAAMADLFSYMEQHSGIFKFETYYISEGYIVDNN